MFCNLCDIATVLGRDWPAIFFSSALALVVALSLAYEFYIRKVLPDVGAGLDPDLPAIRGQRNFRMAAFSIGMLLLLLYFGFRLAPLWMPGNTLFFRWFAALLGLFLLAVFFCLLWEAYKKSRAERKRQHELSRKKKVVGRVFAIRQNEMKPIVPREVTIQLATGEKYVVTATPRIWPNPGRDFDEKHVVKLFLDEPESTAGAKEPPATFSPPRVLKVVYRHLKGKPVAEEDEKKSGGNLAPKGA